MLTQKDLDEIESLIEDKVRNLPTKDEFFSKMDEVMGELDTIREEQALVSHHISDQEDRLEKLEEIVAPVKA